MTIEMIRQMAGSPGTEGVLAKAILDGDEAAVAAFTDLQEENGSIMSTMKVGEKYLVRTITHYYTGEVKEITLFEVVLKNAAWIPDTGRFSECLKTGVFNEVEPFADDANVSRSMIVDYTIWKHPLPRETK